ncbi:PaeR7I family type II restriction endonuclease [Candidatus Foliamicus sp.]
MTLDAHLSSAVKQFWETRASQRQRQGSMSGQRDKGNRTAVTGGKQLDGFVLLVTEMLRDCRLPDTHVYTKKRDVVLPGYFRPTKEWDLVVLHGKNLVATVEFKSQVGSLGNNFNNRVEEALGSAIDLHTAYREGAFAPSPAPWVGYLMMMQVSKAALRPLRVKEPHFQAFNEFRDASYARRYEIFCERLVRERHYNAACLLLSEEASGLKGEYEEPSEELCFRNFAGSLIGHVVGTVKAAGQ